MEQFQTGAVRTLGKVLVATEEQGTRTRASAA